MSEKERERERGRSISSIHISIRYATIAFLRVNFRHTQLGLCVNIIKQKTTGVRWLIDGPDFRYIEYLIGPRRTFENGLYRDSHNRDMDWTFSYDAVGGNAIRNRWQTLFFYRPNAISILASRQVRQPATRQSASDWPVKNLYVSLHNHGKSY